MRIAERLDNLKKQLDQASGQVQKNINSRLDGMYFRVMSEADFEDEETHYDEQITFVIKTVDGETKIDIYKGDIKINFGGGGGSEIENTVIVGDLE